jgi:hypothetical protein
VLPVIDLASALLIFLFRAGIRIGFLRPAGGARGRKR